MMRLSALLAAGLLAAAPAAQAAMVDWELNADFGGFSAVGTFTYDDVAGTFSAIDISVGGESFNDTASFLASASQVYFFRSGSNPQFGATGKEAVLLFAATSFTSTGNLTSNFDSVYLGTCEDLFCTNFDAGLPTASSLSGTLTGTVQGAATASAVPLPAALPMALAGLAGLGLVSRRRG